MPLIALRDDGKKGKVIVALGDSAHTQDAEALDIVNPFSHPRTIIAEPYGAEKVIRHCFNTLRKYRLFVSPYAVVVHPMEKNEGGLTEVEKAALDELFVKSGARETLIYEGDELSPDTLHYPSLFKEVNKDKASDVAQGRKVAGTLAALLGLYAVALVAFFWVAG
ncbi:hypothetical protein A8L45_00380 [Veronia pacifica]|uniref:Rod shape-determining protein MreB n=2 Tax=Veronia pacifica TaxID=1080227 RepID=A0A1C3ES55_9GAMM|nr:hypothetical protein A8L45_00380 [Veronia pacifica]